MRKSSRKISFVLGGCYILIILLVNGCTYQPANILTTPTKEIEKGSEATTTLSPFFLITDTPLSGPKVLTESSLPTEEANLESMILALAQNTIQAIKEKNMDALGDLVHPTFGVRFSPYGYIQPKYPVFTANHVKNLLQDQTNYQWGSYDGSGEPIILSFNGYYERFIYDQDFAMAPEVGYNQILGKGNSLININEFFPESVFVEFHFPGFDPQYAGMDWRSLRLVFQELDGKWYLVGIIHDQWTT